MKKIDVSVLIPVYKVEKYIEKCSRSLFEQSLKDNIEYIFIDDSSPDNSIDILKTVILDYPYRKNQIKILKHNKNRGLGETRNTALDNAKGEYIYIIDSDDWMLQNDALEHMLRIAHECNADIVEANHCNITINGVQNILNKRNYSSKSTIIQDIICKKTQITIWNKLIKKSLYDSNNIRVPKGLNNGEDYVTLPLLMFFANKIINADIYAYAYNQTNINSYRSNRSDWRNLDSMIYANRYLKDFFVNNSPEFVKNLERMYLETKAYHLLYSHSIEELNRVRQKFPGCNNTYFFHMRWKYQVVLLLNTLRINWLILRIGKIFRNRR